MSQILRCDWLPERERWSYLACSGLPVSRPLGIESSSRTTMQSFFDLLVVMGENAHSKCSVNSQHLPKRNDSKRMELSWCSENFVSATMNVS